jgi:NADH dehydrogenase
MNTASLPHVVIIGGGFAGLSAARELAKAAVRVTLIDRSNHHVFQPLLYQVATAALAPSDITVPIRWRLRSNPRATVLLAEVTSIDPRRRVVTLDNGTRDVDYDYLIVATGARHAYFGRDEWEIHAPGLKGIDDAYNMRQRFLLAFELAEKSLDPVEREALLTFIVVGGGPTGVELAGTIPEITKGALWRDFRNIDTRRARVLLVEAGPRLLPFFPEDLSAAARRDLEKLGVEVRLGTPVTSIDERSVTVGEQRIPARTVFWAAGNIASSLGKQLDAETDRSGRVKVANDLSVPAHPEVFVVGDLCYVERPDGRPVPAVAPTANQTGRHAARTIRRLIAGEPRLPFKYFHKGDLATIGRHKAVAAFGTLHISGYIAWWLWLFVHLMYLVGFRNRVTVLIQWAYAYLTYSRGVRLIAGTWRADAKTITRAESTAGVAAPAPSRIGDEKNSAVGAELAADAEHTPESIPIPSARQ